MINNEDIEDQLIPLFKVNDNAIIYYFNILLYNSSDYI